MGAGLLERGLIKKRKDGLVVPGTYTILFQSRRLLETLKTELDKKVLTLKHMEIGKITMKYIMSYINKLLHFTQKSFLYEKGGLIERGLISNFCLKMGAY